MDFAYEWIGPPDGARLLRARAARMTQMPDRPQDMREEIHSTIGHAVTGEYKTGKHLYP